MSGYIGAVTRHGYSSYSNGHCRCEVCRMDKAAYVRQRRALLAKRRQAGGAR